MPRFTMTLLLAGLAPVAVAAQEEAPATGHSFDMTIAPAAIEQKDPSGPDTLRAVVTAFSTLAQGGDPALRPGIDAAFRTLAAEGPPALAAEAAKQLTWAQDWSQAEAFADRLASGALADPAAEFLVSVYLEAAREASGPADPPADWRLE